MHGMATSPAVSIQGIHKYYSDFHALRGIDLEITKGEVCVAIGPSGSDGQACVGNRSS